MSTETQNNTFEKVPSESMHEKADRELAFVEELLEESALTVTPCTVSELRDSVAEQRKQEGIGWEIGNTAVWNLINREHLVLDEELTVHLSDELQIIANTRNSADHLV